MVYIDSLYRRNSIDGQLDYNQCSDYLISQDLCKCYYKNVHLVEYKNVQN